MTTTTTTAAGTAVQTHEGGSARLREERSELFLTAVSTLGTRTDRKRGLHGGAYETTEGRTSRLRELVESVGLEDPRWMLGFIQWLRDQGNMRTVTQQVACAFVHARLTVGAPDETGPGKLGVNRAAINVACGRLTDVGELIDHYRDTYGTKLPMPVKRGAADAVTRLTSERALLAADGQRQDWRLGDVIELTHPKPKDGTQSKLFEYALNRRHGRKVIEPAAMTGLPVIQSHEDFVERRKADPDATREWLLEDTTRIRAAGLRWEDLSGLGKMDARGWAASIDNMGYLGLLRNLRNMDEASVSEDVKDRVKTRLADPVEQERAGLFPLQLYAAIREVRKPRSGYSDYMWTLPTFESTHWDEALEAAVQASVRNIPSLGGYTLVLVDVSGSMISPMSGQGSVTFAEHARLFGTAVALRAEKADLFAFDTSTHRVDISKARRSMIETVFKFPGGGGTNIPGSVKKELRQGHTRVIILTDEQTMHDGGRRADAISEFVGETRSLYVFNVAGYSPSITDPKRPLHRGFGGLTDQAFKLIPMIESGVTEDWPFSY